jgi:hypothetical protein
MVGLYARARAHLLAYVALRLRLWRRLQLWRRLWRRWLRLW